jgi:hypothetical protein
MVCPPPIAQVVQRRRRGTSARADTPDASRVLSNGLAAQAWLDMPEVAVEGAGPGSVSTPLHVLASNRQVALSSLQAALET